MRPEAKAKARLRHAQSIAIYLAWLDQFPLKKRPNLKRRIAKFDECVDFMTPEAIRKSGRNRNKRAKIERSTPTRSNS